MKTITSELQRFRGTACVTITLKTHRTHPENKQDSIQLKNLIKTAERRLAEEYDQSVASERVAQLEKLAEQIDFDRNLDGLLLVAGENFGELVPLPIDVENRVVIDDNFATRELVRALHSQSAYYVLVLSQKQVRLILAYGDRVARELGAPFPMQNDTLHPDSREEAAVGNRQDQLVEEFFNRVDKQVQKSIKAQPHPIVIASDRRNFDYFQKVADKDLCLAHLNGSYETARDHEIVSLAWARVRDALAERNAARLEELKQAVSQQRFTSDLSEIWQAIQAGRGRTLFVERGYFQPARIENGQVIPEEAPDSAEVLDDVVDEMVEANVQFGGDTVFVDPGQLQEFQKVALVTRY